MGACENEVDGEAGDGECFRCESEYVLSIV